MRPFFDFRNSRPGDHYQVTRDASGRITDFRYVNDSQEVLHAHWTGTEYLAEIETTEFITRRGRIAGVIETSLYDAIAKLGEKPYLATIFASLFTWETDINGQAHSGDVFQAIYERRYRVESDGSENLPGSWPHPGGALPGPRRAISPRSILRRMTNVRGVTSGPMAPRSSANFSRTR